MSKTFDKMLLRKYLILPQEIAILYRLFSVCVDVYLLISDNGHNHCMCYHFTACIFKVPRFLSLATYVSVFSVQLLQTDPSSLDI